MSVVVLAQDILAQVIGLLILVILLKNVLDVGLRHLLVPSIINSKQNGYIRRLPWRVDLWAYLLI